ncbi:uncharacterized protein LOC112513603 isoform X1 [Cynara cardunculus var. scolymus]|uniref:uncharacterized protein LOC112513603 isoform X1 n=1 Tax=Cynara cardunculus var. scolymus TaxID=59895 RepID=UPI000D62571B|nr:uncharacterized protein LOC112513603 isoform X1 [Cynara cardunculus var. scolymus]
MAFASYLSSLHVEASSKHSIIASSVSISPQFSLPLSSSSSFSSSSVNRESRKLSIFPNTVRIGPTVKVKPQAGGVNSVAEAFTEFKHLLLPITDRNPYLSEGTRQAAATTAALAKKYGADITVVVIDEKLKESLPEHDTQLSSIRWHLSEGGFQEFKLLERLGEGSKPTAIIGEIADDMNLDLVIMSMEAIHSKHVDANLLAEFIPCPVILLPL